MKYKSKAISITKNKNAHGYIVMAKCLQLSMLKSLNIHTFINKGQKS